MRSPSKIFFDSLQQRLINLFHQSHSDLRLETSLRKDILAQDRIMFHTFAENRQSLPKCGIVSYDKLQRQQIGLKCHPRFCRLSTVRILLCNMVHTKKEILAQFSPPDRRNFDFTKIRSELNFICTT
jgi:hypothetical protein